MMTDPISDYLTRIRNAIHAKHSEVTIPHSTIKEKISEIFVNHKYIRSYEVSADGNKKSIKIELELKDKESFITEMKRISKPGRRVYLQSNEIKPVYRGFGIGIFSTNQGILTDSEARKRNLGGEFLLTIW